MISFKSGFIPALFFVYVILQLNGCSNEREEATQIEDSTIRLYHENCSICHGKNGQGDGKAAIGLKQPLLPFINEISKFERYEKIKDGGQQMPSWSEYFDDTQIYKLVDYVEILAAKK